MGDPVSQIVGGAVANVFDNQREETHQIVSDAKAAQANLEKQLADQVKKEEDDAFSGAMKARRRVLSRASRANYNRGTLLTSPIGLIGDPQTAGKTLLGS